MKKIFSILAMAAVVAVSCNKEDKPAGENGGENTPPAEQVSRWFDDFEDGGMLTWSAEQGATFEIVDNPAKTGVNTSAKVGKVVTGSAQWDFLWSTGFGDDGNGGFDFVTFSEDGFIVKVDVYSPKANSPVYLKFEGVDAPATEITNVTTTKVNEWETLEFDYETYNLVDGAYKNFVILFDAGVENEGGDVFYFDNVRLCKE